MRVGGDGPEDELDGAAGLPELLQEEHLIGIPAGQPVGAIDGDDFELARRGGIPQAVQARAVEPGAGVAGVGEDVLRAEVMAVLAGPRLEGRDLAVDRLVVVLSLG